MQVIIKGDAHKIKRLIKELKLRLKRDRLSVSLKTDEKPKKAQVIKPKKVQNDKNESKKDSNSNK